jgi:hypothetical protein
MCELRGAAHRGGADVVAATADSSGSGGAPTTAVDQRRGGGRGLLTRPRKKRKRRERKGVVALLYQCTEVGDGLMEGATWRQGVGEGTGGAPGRRYRLAAARPRRGQMGGACAHGRC